MKKKILFPLLFLLAAAFILLPTRTASLYIRLYFHEIAGDECTLYYSTDAVNVFCIEQHCSSSIDHENKMVEFRLDPSLDGHITGFRLDFPGQEQLLGINSVTVSSGGVIKRQYNPCDFFSPENVAETHGINALDLATASARAYFATAEDEPYVILSQDLSRQVAGCYSHLRLTRLAVCLFLLACFFLGRKKIFRAEPLLP